MLASICRMLQVDTLSELLGHSQRECQTPMYWMRYGVNQKTPAGLNLLDDFVLLDTGASWLISGGLLHGCVGVD